MEGATRAPALAATVRANMLAASLGYGALAHGFPASQPQKAKVGCKRLAIGFTREHLSGVTAAHVVG